MKKKVKGTTTKAAAVSTEEKIKEAARKVFTEKGFKAARTRDIADAAGINLALLNYYFRSKKKLFDMVMMENFQKFLMGVGIIANQAESTWQEKVDQLVVYYYDMLLANPDITLFVLTEIKNHPEVVAHSLNQRINFLQSVFIQQIQEASNKGEIKALTRIQVMSNTMGLIIFPFIARDLMKALLRLNDTQFIEAMNERKKLVPEWIKSILLTNKPINKTKRKK